MINHLGLHARAAAKLGNLVSCFDAAVKISYGDSTADARSILGILSLGIGFDKTISVMVDGPDEIAAMDAIAVLFGDGFGES